MIYRLNVQYREKDEAKAYGARWNSRERFWYYEGPEDSLPEGLRRWYDGPEMKGEGQDPPVSDVKNALDFLKENRGFRTVSEFARIIRDVYDETKEFHSVMVVGEITNYSGHKRNYYFSLKDDKAILPCVIWESDAARMLKFELKNGQQVAVLANLDYYEAGGRTQLKVMQIHNIGEGKINLALLALKEKLKAEGLFDPKYKKPIPKYPRAIGIVTSKDGQAIRDIQKVAGQRNPYVRLVLYSVNVQGANAVRTIVEGIRNLDARGLDTIIVGRGGGSDEDLMAYNDELVVRAVFEARTPIISAVGHEGNWTLTDYVSDWRVVTPTEAGIKAVTDVVKELEHISELEQSIRQRMQAQLRSRRLMLDVRRTRLDRYDPARLIRERKDLVLILKERMQKNVTDAFERRKHRFEVLLTALHGLSPTSRLVRGFGYISHEGKPVTSVEEVKTGDMVMIRIHDGQMGAQIKNITKTSKEE